MTTPERSGTPESDGTPELMQELLDQTTYIVSEAFDYMLLNTRRGYSEFVQIDTDVIPGLKLYSVLLSSTGGKPEEGAELIRVLAYPSRAEAAANLEEAVSLMHSGADLPFRTDRFVVEHISGKKDEQPALMLLTESGIDELHRGEELEQQLEDFEVVDLSSLLQNIVELASIETPNGEGNPTTNGLPIEKLLFALDLQEKLSDNQHWFVIPQN